MQLEPPPIRHIEDIYELHAFTLRGQELLETEGIPAHFLLLAQLLDRLGADPDERRRALRDLHDKMITLIDQWCEFVQARRWAPPLPGGTDDPSPVAPPALGLLGPAVDTPTRPETLPEATEGPDEPPATGPGNE